MLFALSIFAIVLLLVINDWVIRLHNKSRQEEINFYNNANEKFEEGHKTLDKLLATMPEQKNGIPETIIYHHEDGSVSHAIYYNDTFIDLGKRLTYPTIDESLIDAKVEDTMKG